MSTHDYVIANASGSSVRSDLNNALAAIVSNNSSSSEPSTKYAYMLWVDTTNNLIKLRNSANNAWITLFTTAGGLDVDAASNFNEDVTFTGASANVTWDKSADDLIFNDNAKAVFGTSSDGVEIYHNGSNSYIKDSGTGNFILVASQMQVISADETEMCARFEDGGSVELYEAGTKRFETNSTGVSIAGTTISNGGDFISYDNGHLKLGTNSDLDLFHSGTDSFIRNAINNLNINAGNSAGNVYINLNENVAGVTSERSASFNKN